MILGIDWPDLIIGAVLAFGIFHGWRRGFINELSGAVALFVAVVAAFHYPGTWDATVVNYTQLSPGSAHAVALIAFAAVFYLITYAIGAALSRVAKLPLLNIVNGALGGVVGLAKALLLVWFVLFVALFFPLSPDLRRDLHGSTLAAFITQSNQSIDDGIRKSFPWFAQPFAKDYFKRDHV
ncbi:MAG: CvpA family protein [Vulcanimicrobiaceae bacterium]